MRNRADGHRKGENDPEKRKRDEQERWKRVVRRMKERAESKVAKMLVEDKGREAA